MNKTFAILITAVLLFCVGMVGLLLALGRDAEQLIDMIGLWILPTAISLFTAKAALKAEHNTNGRMTQLIEALHSREIEIPEGYEEWDESSPATPVDDTEKPR